MKSHNNRPERDRAIFAVLRSIRGVSHADVAKKAGVSAQTIAKWRRPVADGGTKYPQFYTLNQVARAYGKEFRLVDRDESRQRHDADHHINA